MTKELSGRLTVYFDDPFWVGVFERIRDGKLSAARVVFGAEPMEEEVYTFILEHFTELKFGPAVDVNEGTEKVNRKRAQREADEMIRSVGIGTKSQQALQRLREQNKLERKEISREEKKAEDRKRFEIRQLKKQEKRKGH